MKVYLTALGCRLNEAELQSWERSLAERGHRVVSRPEQAHVLVLNSCAVTGEAARKSRKLSRRLHRCNPEALNVLVGCLATLDPRQAAEVSGVDLALDNMHKERLVELLEQHVETRLTESAAAGDVRSGGRAAPVEVPPRRTRAFVKVQDGCRYRCSYCVVTLARGDERSKPVEQVVAEVNMLAGQGYRDICLSGVHLGGYDADTGTDLSALVRAVLARTTTPRIRLSSIEPWDLPADFWSLWDDPRLCAHVHLPLQSGSDRVLRRMARRCGVESFRDVVRRARGRVADLVLTTDIIVGFPGETEEDFQQTLSLCEQLSFAHVHVFAYSPREGTAAVAFEGQVAEELKRQRSKALHRVTALSRKQQLDRFVGTTREVLWEGPREAIGSARQVWAGLTDNYLRVHTEVEGTVDLQNRLTQTELMAHDGEQLIGRIAGLANQSTSPALGSPSTHRCHPESDHRAGTRSHTCAEKSA